MVWWFRLLLNPKLETHVPIFGVRKILSTSAAALSSQFSTPRLGLQGISLLYNLLPIGAFTLHLKMASSIDGAAKAVSDLALGSTTPAPDMADSAPGSEENISKK